MGPISLFSPAQTNNVAPQEKCPYEETGEYKSISTMVKSLGVIRFSVLHIYIFGQHLGDLWTTKSEMCICQVLCIVVCTGGSKISAFFV